MTPTNIPATRSQTWGFWGTMDEQASAAWPLAMTAVAAATGENLDTIRAFLDSRFGRHYADDVLNGLYAGKNLEDAIDAATTKWMGWTINHHTSKEYNIPRGLPYLAGFVIHCGIVEEELAA